MKGNNQRVVNRNVEDGKSLRIENRNAFITIYFDTCIRVLCLGTFLFHDFPCLFLALGEILLKLFAIR